MLTTLHICPYHSMNWSKDFLDEDVLCANIDEIKEHESWTMYFDGALNQNGKWIGIVLLSPEGVAIPKAFKVEFPATNNEMEYEALLAGSRETANLEVIKFLEIQRWLSPK